MFNLFAEVEEAFIAIIHYNVRSNLIPDFRRQCEGVELPESTESELNSTLRHSNDVLSAETEAATEVLQHASDRLQHGITVVQHIRGIIGEWVIKAL